LILEDNDHQRATARDAQAAARRHEIDLQVFYAGNLAVQQAQDIMRFVHLHADEQLGVMLIPVADAAPGNHSSVDALLALARRVVAKGAAWLVLNRGRESHVRALRQEFPHVPAAAFNLDQDGFGRLQGRQWKALLPHGGRVLHVVGNPLVTSSQRRRAAMLEEIRGAGLSLDEVEGGWSLERAREAVQRWLARAVVRGAEPNLVGCQNDAMALGAYEALQHAARDLDRPGLRRVPVTGGDGLPEGGQRWVTEGELAATIVMPTTSGLAVARLAEEWEGRGRMAAETILPVAPFPALEQLSPRLALVPHRLPVGSLDLASPGRLHELRDDVGQSDVPRVGGLRPAGS
jgi:hypothetical protein